MPIILTLRRLRQYDDKASLVYTVSSIPIWATLRDPNSQRKRLGVISRPRPIFAIKQSKGLQASFFCYISKGW
jgi:hypothetical protein